MEDGERPAVLHVFFDVDHALICIDGQHANSLRPGASEAMQRLKAAGRNLYVWSAGGREYVERVVRGHGLAGIVDGCFDKDPAVQPRPELIIRDNWSLVQKYGGHLVSQYQQVNDADRELLDVVELLPGGAS